LLLFALHPCLHFQAAEAEPEGWIWVGRGYPGSGRGCLPSLGSRAAEALAPSSGKEGAGARLLPFSPFSPLSPHLRPSIKLCYESSGVGRSGVSKSFLPVRCPSSQAGQSPSQPQRGMLKAMTPWEGIIRL